MDVFETMFRRRSIRAYRNRTVERAKIRRILEAAMAAPSGRNFRPWEFVVVDEEQNMAALRSCVRALEDGRRYNAPAAIVVLDNTRYIPWESDCVSADCHAAIENMLLAVTALGLGAVWIGDYDAKNLIEQLAIPEHVRLAGVILIGYPAEEHPPRTQYADDAVFWQKYDPARPLGDRKEP